MGWVWDKDDADDSRPYDAEFENPNPGSDGRCVTRKIVKSTCRTQEVEPGKFVRKCEKTEQLLRDCVGRPSEVVQSNKEYTEEDVTEEMKKGFFALESSDIGPFGFPGLRSDIEAIERRFIGGFGRFFEAAEEMKDGFFSIFGSPPIYDDGDSSSSSSSRRQEIPIEEDSSPKPNASEAGHVDLSGLAKDV